MANEIFNQDLLLEIILDYVIHKEKDNISRRDIHSVRLVQKKWLQVTAKLLQAGNQPLYKLALDGENSVEGSAYVQCNGKLLDRFVNFINTSSSSARTTGEYKSYFGLKLMEDFFRGENHKSLSNCFRMCGSRLVEMEMHIPVNFGSLPCILPKFSLPVLKRLTIYLTETKLDNLADEEEINPSTANITALVQFILNATENLSDLCMPATRKLCPVIRDLPYISLPESITNLNLTCVSTSDDLGILISNTLPHLEHLHLLVPAKPLLDDILYKVFDNFKDTLKTLKLTGTYYKPPRCPTYFHFPEMSNLHSLHLATIECELESDLVCLETSLYKLKNLVLKHQTIVMFRKWCQDSRFETVNSLEVQLVSGGISRANEDGYFLGVDLENMQMLHRAFPNVAILKLSFCGTQTNGLKYMFMEMGQLKSLEIVVVDSEAETNSDFWDALLTGISKELACALRTNPELRDHVQLNNDSLPSIKLLKELTTLSLEANYTPPTPPEEGNSLISDISFHYALLKMPKLRQLGLQGRFMISDAMAEQWENRGRNLDYSLPVAT